MGGWVGGWGVGSGRLTRSNLLFPFPFPFLHPPPNQNNLDPSRNNVYTTPPTQSNKQSMHLVADHLGWFEKGEKGFRIEDLLRERGERVLTVGEDDLRSPSDLRSGDLRSGLTAEDVAGWSKVQELIQAAGSGGSGGNSGGGSGGAPSIEQQAAAGRAGGVEDGGVLAVEPADLHAWAKVAKAGSGGGGDERSSSSSGGGGGDDQQPAK